MKRILLMVIRNIFRLPKFWFRLCYYAKHVDKYTEEERYAMLKDIVYHANRTGRVTIEVYGIDNIPKEDGFIFYPNHQGLFDVLAVLDVCPVPFSVVNKKEVAKIPFLKQVFACMKAYSIDREDIKQSMQVILQITKDVKAGRNFLIFAEGTRSRQGNQLLDFKGGSFKSATRAKCPIVPMAIIDAYKAFDTSSTKKLIVQVHFLKPMFYDEYKGLKTVEIAAKVKDEIAETIQTYEKQ
jgi:1-acyl-sn-glycerol-3-phosphate acyltransferases